jgi:hypothetical protein
VARRLPDRGRDTGQPESVADYGVDDVVAHHAAIIAELPARPALVGHSFGMVSNPANVFNFVATPGGGGDVDTYIKPSLVPGCFAAGLPADQAAVIAATQRPLAASTLQEPSGAPA